MKKKFLKILVVMIILVITYASIVNALSLTVTMDSASTVAESTEFTVKVKVSNLDVGPNGITSLSGYIKFSKEIFENISESSIEGLNGWSAQYATDSTKLTLTKQTFVKSDEDVFNLTLKTKPGTSGKEDVIKFTNIMVSNNDTEFSASDVSTKVMIGTSSGNIANVSNTGSTNGAPVAIVQNRVNNVTTNSSTNVARNNSVNNSITSFVNTTNETDDDIPYTGVEDTIPFILVGIVALAIVFYIKIEKLNNDIK